MWRLEFLPVGGAEVNYLHIAHVCISDKKLRRTYIYVCSIYFIHLYFVNRGFINIYNKK